MLLDRGYIDWYKNHFLGGKVDIDKCDIIRGGLMQTLNMYLIWEIFILNNISIIRYFTNKNHLNKNRTLKILYFEVHLEM